MRAFPPMHSIECPHCGGDGGFSVPDRLASIGSPDGYAERWEECDRCDGDGWVEPEDEAEAVIPDAAEEEIAF